jgi:glycine/D-amino acid oxidase-like deaminating enzyme
MAALATVDDNASVWAATAAPVEPLPRLEGEQRADVAIVGAGFTGLSTAYHLSARFPDRRVVVLEAGRVGSGASGRNAGMALHWLHGPELADRALALRLYRLTTETLDGFAETAARHGFPLRFRRTGTLEAVTDTRRAEAAHADAEKLASWGLPIRFLRGEELTSRLRATGVVGGTWDPTTGQLHGLDWLHGLRGVLLGRGVAIHERSPVVRIDAGREHVLATPHGVLRAPTLVLATNGYTPSLGYFRRGVLPLHSHCIATEPLPLERWRELGWGELAGFSDDLDRIAYASLTDDGRLILGGGGNPAYDYYFGGRTVPPRPATAGFDFVRGVLERYFPGARDVRIGQRWSGTLGITLRRQCSMGIAGPHRNLLYALGYSGHGVVLANLAGRVLCDLYADHREPWQGLPFLQAPLEGLPPEPLRWLGYRLYTALTGRAPRRR